MTRGAGVLEPPARPGVVESPVIVRPRLRVERLLTHVAPLTVSDLARALDLTPGTVTNALGALGRQGKVRRVKVKQKLPSKGQHPLVWGYLLKE